MPKGSDWIQFIYVNLGFLAQIVALYFFSSIAEIKQNWPKYRCNPIFMPLADNIEENFVYCIQNMQSSFMGYILQPLSFILNGLTAMGGELSTEINSSRNIIGYIRDKLMGGFSNIFGVFLNIIVEFQKIMIGIKDLIGKLVATMVTMMYIMDGSMKTMGSTWNGPLGQSVRNLSGACFHPSTQIKLKSGKIVKMSDINLGDYLENGSKVVASMKVDNSNNLHKLYKFSGKGVNNGDIYVTGTHHVLYNNKFIKVQDCPIAEVQTELESDWFSCLITHDHKIQIGDQIFWDWEDWLLYKK